MITRLLNFLPAYLGNTGLDTKLADVAMDDFYSIPRPNQSVSAVVRVKNGEFLLMPSVVSVLPFISELVIVDNMSTDKTSDVIDQVQDIAENYGINLIRKKYEIEVHRHGDNYQRKLFDRPDGSIADFYNYAFSLASGEYVFKLDAGCIFFPNAIRRFVSMVSADRPLIRYRGIEAFGKTMAYEPSIIKRELLGGYRDSKKFEEIILSQKIPRYDIRNFYLPPAFLHYRRLVQAART